MEAGSVVKGEAGVEGEIEVKSGGEVATESARGDDVFENEPSAGELV